MSRGELIASHPGPAEVSAHTATRRLPRVGCVELIAFFRRVLPLLSYNRRLFTAVIALLALAACGNRLSLAAASDLPTGVPLTPSGAIALHPHQYGQVLPWHIETAEASWLHVAPCVEVELGVPSQASPFGSRQRQAQGEEPKAPGSLHIGGPGGDHIEIIGASWDFDPARPEATPGPTAEIARLLGGEPISVQHLDAAVRRKYRVNPGGER